VKPIELKLDGPDSLYKIFKKNFTEHLKKNNEFSPFRNEIAKSIKAIFETLPMEYFIAFERCYEYLDALEGCITILKMPGFGSFNIIDRCPERPFLFRFSKEGETKCLSILPVITHRGDARRLVYSSEGFKVFIVLNEGFFTEGFNVEYLPFLVEWKRLSRVYDALKDRNSTVIKKYLEFCFKEFKEFYDIEYLARYGTYGAFEFNTYLLDRVVNELGGPTYYKYHPWTPLTQEGYVNFLKVNGLKKAIWHDLNVFDKFYKFIENDINQLIGVEDDKKTDKTDGDCEEKKSENGYIPFSLDEKFKTIITTSVIPVTDKITSKDMLKIKELIRNSVFYLENITKCRYYPVPTIIVDDIPSEDREKYKDDEEKENNKRESKSNLWGVYFHPGYVPSDDFVKILTKSGYNDAFIKSLSVGGAVIIAYNRCEAYVNCKKEKYKDDLGDTKTFFWDLFNAVLIHEHAHAIMVEGIDSNNKQLQYPINKFYRTYADKIVCESIAGWLSMNYYKREAKNRIISDILTEHSSNNNKPLCLWPYGGAIYLEKVKSKFIDVFNNFRKNVEDAVPIFLSDVGKYDDEYIIKLFCAFKNNEKLSLPSGINKKVLITAIKFIENADFIDKLIKNGADVNEHDGDENSALILAITYKYLDVVKVLIDEVDDVDETDKDGNTALMLISKNGHLAYVKYLIEKKADVNKVNKDGETALTIAMQYDYSYVVKFLIGHVADINKDDKNGNTALMLVSKYGCLEDVKYLIKKGSDINKVNKDGNTPLILASLNGHAEIVKHLLNAGAKFDIENKLHNSALDLAGTDEVNKIIFAWRILSRDEV